jgi:hypothetical protein
LHNPQIHAISGPSDNSDTSRSAKLLGVVDPPPMIQTGLVLLHPGAVRGLPQAARLSVNPL